MGVKKPKVPPPPPPPPQPQRANASDTLLSSTVNIRQPVVGAEPSIIARALNTRSQAQRKQKLGAS